MQTTSPSYCEWLSLYDDHVQSIYQNEKTDQLKTLSMLFFALQREFKKIRNDLAKEINVSKTDKCIDNEQNSFSFDEKNLNSSENKENVNCIPETESININSYNTAINDYKILLKSPKRYNAAIKKDVSPLINKSSERFINPKKKNSSLSKKVDSVKGDDEDLDESVIDCSIIEVDPQIKNQKYSIKALDSMKNKERKKIRQNLTKSYEKTKPKVVNETPELMDIDEMIDYINRTQKNENDIKESDLQDSEITFVDGFDNIIDNKACEEKVTDDQTNLANEKLPSKNSLSLKISNNVKKKKLEPSYAYKEVVRGKERKNLKGWLCHQCENFYKHLNLKPEELQKKIDECSRHLSKFKPRNETFDGFWDLTIQSPPDAKRNNSK